MTTTIKGRMEPREEERVNKSEEKEKGRRRRRKKKKQRRREKNDDDDDDGESGSSLVLDSPALHSIKFQVHSALVSYCYYYKLPQTQRFNTQIYLIFPEVRSPK